MAWLPEQVSSVHPGLSDDTFVVLTVEHLIFSFQLMVMLLFKVTFIAPSAGFVDITAGAVLSTVTVCPAEGVSILPSWSVALLLME